MSIDEWIALIQAHRLSVVGAAIVVLAIVILFIRSYRRRPTLTMLGFMAVVMMLVGASVLHEFVTGSAALRSAHRWPTAPGVILVSKTDKITYNTTEHRDHQDVTARATSTRTVITYQYTPGPATGRSYKSSTVRLSNRPNTSGLVDQYPVGKQVTVHYDPNDPAVATLELESTESLVGLVFGVALELMGIAAIYFLVRLNHFLPGHNLIAAVLDDGPARSLTTP
jgi:uncharacterized protein DUF3592